jgi:hypothetical protein
MPSSVARILTSLVLALALVIGGVLHGSMSGGMADPVNEQAVSHMDGDDRCQGCAEPTDALSGADCTALCANQMGLIAAAASPESLDGSASSLRPFAAMAGIAAPPDPSPPKRRLG